jgi:hypothetical protein
VNWNTSRITALRITAYQKAIGIPRNRVRITGRARSIGTPAMGLDFAIRRITPLMKHPVPSVTISEWIMNQRMKKALIAPTAASPRIAMRIAGPLSQPSGTLRNAISIGASAIVEATDRSKSPVVSGRMRPSVRTTIIAVEPNIAARLLRANPGEHLVRPEPAEEQDQDRPGTREPVTLPGSRTRGRAAGGAFGAFPPDSAASGSAGTFGLTPGRAPSRAAWPWMSAPNRPTIRPAKASCAVSRATTVSISVPLRRIVARSLISCTSSTSWLTKITLAPSATRGPHEREELIDPGARQVGRRFVEDEDAGRTRMRPQVRDRPHGGRKRLLYRRKPRHRGPRVEVERIAGKDRGRRRMFRPPADPPAVLRRRIAKAQVPGHRERGDDTDVPVHEGKAKLAHPRPRDRQRHGPPETRPSRPVPARGTRRES